MKSNQDNKSDSKLIPEEIFFAGVALSVFIVIVFAIILFLFITSSGN